jgi:hypothetical protein
MGIHWVDRFHRGFFERGALADENDYSLLWIHD